MLTLRLLMLAAVVCWLFVSPLYADDKEPLDSIRTQLQQVESDFNKALTLMEAESSYSTRSYVD